tara:strand:- start:1453 stop:3015 length:1563 start_codon:yes stop_codon:yes gene_type:complete
MILLGLFTLLLRYPITPSPTGDDNFYYISMATSIISHGQIFWAEVPLSLYGLFPGTSPLGATLLASAVTTATGLSIYDYILLHGISLSLISTFGFFMLSGELTDNYRSRWFAALCFSLAPRFLTFSSWRFSLRFTFIALLPFFIWLLLRLSNSKYGRHPSRLIVLLSLLILVLPSLHRMALLFPGMLLALLVAHILFYWQENATNRERAGRQTLGFLIFLSGYLFYLQYLDFSPYSPDDELIGAYLFSGDGILSTLANLAVYYMINVGPFIFIAILGLLFWVQEGRIKLGYLFSMSYLTLSFFVISDVTYIPYLLTFGILLFMAPGFDFFLDNLQDHPKRISALFSVLIVLLVSFSYVDLSYRISAHEREAQFYTYYVRDSSISTSQWIENNFEREIFESNDEKRDRRVAAYSDSITQSDSLELSAGLVNVERMEVERISIKDMYWNASDHLWKWNNTEIFSSEIGQNISLSVVNLGMPDMSGKSSTLSLTLNYHYKYMPDFTYRIYSNTELAIYWTPGY